MAFNDTLAYRALSDLGSLAVDVARGIWYVIDTPHRWIREMQEESDRIRMTVRRLEFYVETHHSSLVGHNDILLDHNKRLLQLEQRRRKPRTQAQPTTEDDEL